MSNTTNKKEALAICPANVNGLKCKELRKEVKTIITADVRIEADKWLKALAIAKVREDELYKEDYNSFTAFVEALPTNESNSSFSKYVNAVKFIKSDVAKENGWTPANMIYAKAYLMSTIKDIPDFLQFIGKVDLTQISYASLEDLKKKYNKSKEVVDVEPKNTKEVKESAGKETNEDVEIEVVKEDEPTANIEKGMLYLSYKGKDYIIPMKELKAYQVKKGNKEA